VKKKLSLKRRSNDNQLFQIKHSVPQNTTFLLDINTKKMKKHIYSILQPASILFCIALFILLMLDSFNKFTNKMTNIGVRTEPFNMDKKFPPCITVCPLDAFRKRGFFFKQAEFYQQTFNREEIFINGKIFGISENSILDESVNSIQEIQSVFLGRCYTVCKKALLREHLNAYFTIFNRSVDIKGWQIYPLNYCLQIF